MYYFDNCTQDQIADNLRISKSAVSRLLKEGREKGIITFHIKEPGDRWSSLEEKLERAFKLKEAVVIKKILIKFNAPEIFSRAYGWYLFG